mgnify:CR=1 FL=1
MTTKQRILNEALTLFSKKGYSAVYVGEIAEAVGIKAPSLYKHFKSKQDIFNKILEILTQDYNKQAAELKLNGSNADKDAEFFSVISEDELVKIGKELFLYMLHDDKVRKLRKMLTLEQFHHSELSQLYSKQYLDDPLSYQSTLFSLMLANSNLKGESPDIMALHFYAPIYLMLTLCDREPIREKEALHLIERHIRQFNKIYGGEI